jgi:hypothetical protein
MSCQVESAFNTSIAENLSTGGPPIRHRIEDLQLEDGTYTRTHTEHGPGFEAEVHHHIERATGRFETLRNETRHDAGEHWVIRLVGTCTQVRAEAASTSGSG